jgi:cobalamin biosynthesis protein CobC
MFPNAPLPWLDLSTGISPWAYAIPHLSTECWTRLPDLVALEALVAQARQTYRVPQPATLLPVAGSDLAITVLPRLVGTKLPVRIVSPTYSSHQAAWTAAGFTVQHVATLQDLDTGCIGVVVNPNNPDGRTYEPAALQSAAERLESGGGFLVVDEAFCDVTPELSVLNPDADLSATIVLRSFGKFYGLAGVRLGFVATAHGIGKSLAQTLSDWPVSGPAIAIGTQALADEAWARQTRERLSALANNLQTALRERDFTIVGGTSLFCLASHPKAATHFTHLAERGILVRPFTESQLLRFGMPAHQDDLQRLAAALAAV